MCVYSTTTNPQKLKGQPNLVYQTTPSPSPALDVLHDQRRVVWYTKLRANHPIALLGQT